MRILFDTRYNNVFRQQVADSGKFERDWSYIHHGTFLYYKRITR
jgi:hypothetical protein